MGRFVFLIHAFAYEFGRLTTLSELVLSAAKEILPGAFSFGVRSCLSYGFLPKINILRILGHSFLLAIIINSCMGGIFFILF